MLKRKLLRDILTQKELFAAITSVVVLGVALYGAAYMSYQNLAESIDYSYERLNFGDLWFRVESMPQTVVDEVRAVEGVAVVEGRLVVDVPLPMPGMDPARITARLISLPEGRRPAVNDVAVVAGAYPGTPETILADKSLADYHGIEIGDTLRPIINGEAVTFTVSGQGLSPEYLRPVQSRQQASPSSRDFGVLFVPYAALAPALGMEGRVNDIALTLAPGADPEAVAASVGALLVPFNPRPVISRAEQPSQLMVELGVASLESIAFLFPVLFLSAAGLAMYILLTRVVHSQRMVIGLMRAEGVSRGQVLGHYLAYALIVGVVGSVIGSALGYFLANRATALYTEFMPVPYLRLVPHWDAIVLGVSLSLAFCGLAGLAPARAAMNVTPASAMRGDPPSSGPAGWLGGRRLPFVLRLALRHLVRRRRRALFTTVSFAFAFSLVFVGAGALDSFIAAGRVQYEQVQGYDAQVIFAAPQPASLIEELAGWPGVRRAEPVLQFPVELKRGDRTYQTLLVALPADGTLLKLFELDSGQRVQPGDAGTSAMLSTGLWLGSALRDILDAQPGDELTVTLPAGSMSMNLNGFVRLHAGSSTAFTSLAGLQAMLSTPDITSTGLSAGVTGVLIAADPAQMEAVKERLYDLPAAQMVEITSQTKADHDELMRFAYVLIGVMLAFGAGLAFAVVFNTATVGVLERRQEIATLRTLGTPESWLAGSVALENLIVGVAGVLVGLPFAYWLIGRLLDQMNNDVLVTYLVIYPRTYWLTIGGMLLVLLLSQWPALRLLASVNLAEAIRERAT